MLRKLIVIIVTVFVFSFAYTEEDWQNLYATGYWLQRDNVTKTNIAVIHAYGNLYDYSSGKDKYQGLEFVWNAKKLILEILLKVKVRYITDGAVLNPHDGKYYHVKARTMEMVKRFM